MVKTRLYGGPILFLFQLLLPLPKCFDVFSQHPPAIFGNFQEGDSGNKPTVMRHRVGRTTLQIDQIIFYADGDQRWVSTLNSVVVSSFRPSMLTSMVRPIE